MQHILITKQQNRLIAGDSWNIWVFAMRLHPSLSRASYQLRLLWQLQVFLGIQVFILETESTVNKTPIHQPPQCIYIFLVLVSLSKPNPDQWLGLL